MANYNSQYTGAEVDAAVGKANAIPSVTDINDTVSRALKTPLQVLQNNELVGVDVDGSQIRVQLGEGLTLEGSTSPYTLKASGGGTQLYRHAIYMTKGNDTLFLGIITNRATAYTFNDLYNIISAGKYFNVYAFVNKQIPDTGSYKQSVISVQVGSTDIIVSTVGTYVNSGYYNEKQIAYGSTTTIHDSVSEM